MQHRPTANAKDDVFAGIQQRLSVALSQQERDAITLLRALLGELLGFGNPEKSAETSYWIGRVFYSMPDGVSGREDEAKTWLTRAVSLDPEHAFAHLYLGHLSFDAGHFGEAFERLSRFSSSYFREIEPDWLSRDIALVEMRLTCLLREHATLSPECSALVTELDALLGDAKDDARLSLDHLLAAMKEANGEERVFIAALAELLSRYEWEPTFQDELRALR